MADLKHVGRLKNGGKKCLVAFRTLPGDAYSCLVVPTEGLEDSYHDAITNLVESPSAQSSYEFAEALDRTQFPDGSRMLPALHAKGKLVKIATDQIEMCPRPGTVILLSELNQIIAEQRGVPVDGLAIAAPGGNPRTPERTEVKQEEVTIDTKVETPVAAVTNATITEATGTPEEQAKFYRSHADRLSKEAAAMRRKAEELAPTKKKDAAAT